MLERSLWFTKNFHIHYVIQYKKKIKQQKKAKNVLRVSLDKEFNLLQMI